MQDGQGERIPLGGCSASAMGLGAEGKLLGTVWFVVLWRCFWRKGRLFYVSWRKLGTYVLGTSNDGSACSGRGCPEVACFYGMRLPLPEVFSAGIAIDSAECESSVPCGRTGNLQHMCKQDVEEGTLGSLSLFLFSSLQLGHWAWPQSTDSGCIHVHPTP